MNLWIYVITYLRKAEMNLAMLTCVFTWGCWIMLYYTGVFTFTYPQRTLQSVSAVHKSTLGAVYFHLIIPPVDVDAPWFLRALPDIAQWPWVEQYTGMLSYLRRHAHQSRVSSEQLIFGCASPPVCHACTPSMCSRAVVSMHADMFLRHGDSRRQVIVGTCI